MAARMLGWDFEGRKARVRLAEVYRIVEVEKDSEDPSAHAEWSWIGPFQALIGANAGPYRLKERSEQVYQALGKIAPERLEEAPEPLVAFAEEWGFLGERLGHFSLAPGRYEPPRRGRALVPGVFGELLDTWIFAVRQL